MKKHIPIFFLFFTCFTFVKAQPTIFNIDFESGYFTNWQGAYNNTTCGTSTPNPMTTVGIDTLSSPPQHIIVSTGFDPSVTLASLPVNNPIGGNYSVRLGDTIDGCRASQLTYTFVIGGFNQSVSISYALVFNDNGTHSFNDAPKFMYGLTLCGGTYVIASDTIVYASSDTSFYHGSNSPNDIYYTKWKTICVDLTPWIGVCGYTTLNLISSDCDAGSHRGYAYVDCQMNPSLCSSITSINKLADLSASVSVYPNPASNCVNLSLKSLQSDEFEITLCDIQGTILMKDNFASALGQINKTYKTENLPKGIYFVYIKTKKQGTIQKKVIIN
jgi:hypothetical protein